MINTPDKDQLSDMPELYATENEPLKDKIVYGHFFLNNNHWYVCEYDGEDMFWGFTILHGDRINAEWGFTSFRELRELAIVRRSATLEIEYDTDWQPRPAWSVEDIRI